MQDGNEDRAGVRRGPSGNVDALQWGTLGDWAELVRIPNVFTVLSNSLAAAFLVAHGWPPIAPLVMALCASVMAYWAGMILNDVADLEEDRASGRNRPLVRGSVSPVLAGHIGTGLLLTAPLLVLLATNLYEHQPLWMGAAFAAAVGLSLCVRVYNSPVKHTPLGPLLMGSCRGLNILMVGCVVLAVSQTESFPRALGLLALGISLYVFGITVFARREETDSAPPGLVLGMFFELSGIVVLGLLPWWSDPEGRWYLDIRSGYPILVTLIGLTVLNCGVKAVMRPVPRHVQLAVKHAILTMVLLDATVVAAAAGPWFGGGIALLLLPAMLIAARYRST
jgi:hypothetical protein